jgi:DNA-binding NarL/FixJ family response regulator
MVNLIIADDHSVVRQAIAEMLEKNGQYKVVGQASDGVELLDIINTLKADVVILDMCMPNMDGLTALENLKNNNPTHPPILVLSAEHDERTVRSAIKAGAKGYVPKDAKPNELLFAIDSVISGKTYLSPTVTSMLMANGENGDINSGSLSVLTKREIEIMKHLADGKPNREIAQILHISIRTVDTHRSNILKKLELKTNAELVKLAIQNGLINV